MESLLSFTMTLLLKEKILNISSIKNNLKFEPLYGVGKAWEFICSKILTYLKKF
jgi:hypothetical protein